MRNNPVISITWLAMKDTWGSELSKKEHVYADAADVGGVAQIFALTMHELGDARDLVELLKAEPYVGSTSTPPEYNTTTSPMDVEFRLHVVLWGPRGKCETEKIDVSFDAFYRGTSSNRVSIVSHAIDRLLKEICSKLRDEQERLGADHQEWSAKLAKLPKPVKR